MSRKKPRRHSFPLVRVYQLLEPGPLVLLTTARGGQPNLMPMTWYTMLEFELPWIGRFMVAGRTIHLPSRMA